MKYNTKPVLIYRLGSLGDTVMALPCFHRIKECYPDADITLLTNKPIMAKAAPLQAVLGKDTFFSRTLTYPVGTRNPVVLGRLMMEIKKLKIHTVINITALRSFKADRRDRMFFSLCGVREFIGFDQKPADFELATNESTGEIEWEAKRLGRKIASLGYIDLGDPNYWDLQFTREEQKKAAQAISTIEPLDRMIVINVGTNMPVKDWGIDNWLRLIDLLNRENLNSPLVVIGVDEEYQLGEACLAHWRGPGLNLCGKTSPRVSAAILAYAKLFIGHDSGPMHLAACVGTPCVAVFSCINRPRQWFPRGDMNRILMPKTACAMSGDRNCLKMNEKCILTIQPDHVYQAVRAVLSEVERI